MGTRDAVQREQERTLNAGRIPHVSAGLATARPRGRPAMMSTGVLLEKIRQLASRDEGLYRIHHTHSDLYARARRQFGSWVAAVEAAGMDYGGFLEAARRRSLETRRRKAGRRVR